MAKNKAKPVRTVFLRSQIAASLTSLSVVTGILVLLLLAMMEHRDHLRTTELARSIESLARISKNGNYLQYAITEMIHADRAHSIVVFSKSENRVIAAAASIRNANKTKWILSDPGARERMAQSLKKGVFGNHFITDQGRKIAIFPLAPPFGKNVTSKVVIGAKWPTPYWHRFGEIEKISFSELKTHIWNVFSAKQETDFLLPDDKYSAIIVIEPNRGWFTKLAIRSLVIISILLSLAIFTVVYSLSRALRKNVLKPIAFFSETVSKRASGDMKARIPSSNILEFDELAARWNALLNYRDTAKKQNLVLSTLLDHVPVGIEVTDRDSKIEYVNPAYLKITGLSLIEVIGKTPDILTKSAGLAQPAIGEALVAITNGETWTGEIVSKRNDGKEIICNVTLVPILDSNDRLERVISLRHDITQLKANETALVAAKIKAQHADLAKSEFLTNMSHELRTPLNSIIGFSEIMAAREPGESKTEDFIEFSKMIETSSRSLLESINTILDLSRFESSKFKFSNNEFSPTRILDKVIETRVVKARTRGVEIVREFEPDCTIYTDESIFRQAITALICNAIRFNVEGGQVFVSCKMDGDETVIIISDTGIGIAQDEIEKVTTPFYRVDSALNSQNSGVGLSLALVRKYTESQNIDFTIESAVDKGTTVTLRFLPKNKQVIEPTCRPAAIAM